MTTTDNISYRVEEIARGNGTVTVRVVEEEFRDAPMDEYERTAYYYRENNTNGHGSRIFLPAIQLGPNKFQFGIME